MKPKNIILFAIAAIMAFVACNKSEVALNNPPIQRGPVMADPVKQPYTYLQNKYIDALLKYEFKKQGKPYDSEKYSYDEKRKMVDILDLEKEKYEYEETKEDVVFYAELEKKLMSEINSHPYVKKFVERFALKEVCDEDDMMIIIGEDDTDVIAKFQILQYYEDGFDIFERYLEREKLSGEEEWNLFPMGYYKPDEPEDPKLKGVRYTLVSRWGKTINYLNLNASSTAMSVSSNAMSQWKTAANNKITFSEMANTAWNKTCWVMGWKWFIRFSNISGNVSYSTYGYVPWAMIQLTNSPDTATCLHELGHSLCLYHEHQRPDRDNYIKYHSNNVQSNFAYAFFKMVEGSYNYHGSAFDFNSIMLYTCYSFSKNGQPTLTKKDGTTTWTYNDVKYLSATDKYVIKQMYP